MNIPVTKALIANWMTPLGYTTVRMLFGTFVFWIIGFSLNREKVQRNDLLILVIGGLLGYLGTQFLFSESLRFTSPVHFSLLMALTPLAVLVISFFFLKERITPKKILGLFLSIAGAATVILSNNPQSDPGSNNVLGVFLALLCVLSYATYMVLTRKIATRYHPVTIAKWMFLISVVLLVPFLSSSISNQAIYAAEGTIKPILLLSFSLFFSTLLAFFLMPYALKKLEAGTVSIFMNLQPITASVVAIWVGQDAFSWYSVIAMVLIIVGVSVVSI
jgi:drug/metabolite transporter (DMT)-like permease